MDNKDYISIGKITNFFGIKGEAKVGCSNISQIKNAKTVYMLDSENKETLKIKSCREGKNFVIVKFEGIDDINGIILYKGQRIFIPKKEALDKLDENEYLINDLVGCSVFDTFEKKIGTVVGVSTNGPQDLLNIKNTIGKINLVPFVEEFFPEVDTKNKKITIKPIEGLLS